MFIFCMWHEKMCVTLLCWRMRNTRVHVLVHLTAKIFWVIEVSASWKSSEPVSTCLDSVQQQHMMQRGRHHLSWNLWVMACHTVPSTSGWKKKPTKVSLWGKFVSTKSGEVSDLWNNLVSDQMLACHHLKLLLLLLLMFISCGHSNCIGQTRCIVWAFQHSC